MLSPMTAREADFRRSRWSAGGRVARVIIDSFLVTLRPSSEQTLRNLTNQNSAEGAPGSGFWYLGLGFSASF